jgi:hypothetical protein
MPNIAFATAASQKAANVWNTATALADEGSYFQARNPTVGTVVATVTSIRDATNTGANSAQIQPTMIIYNPWPTADANAKTIYPQYLWTLLGQVPTSATTCNVGIWMEPNGSNCFSSLSTGFAITPTALNPGVSTQTRAKIWFGDLVATATSSGGYLAGYRRLTSLIPVASDEWLFTFGGVSSPTNLFSSSATPARNRSTYSMAPLAIPPGYAMKLGFFAAANGAAMSWEFELGYAERVGGQ